MAKKIIIAGGGTGGHIFPAIAIANALKEEDPAIDILFVGAKGKMEMEKVPQAGYRIEGLDIAGFNRSSLIKNIGLPYKLIKSFWQVRKIVRSFQPDAAIGVGGYSSFPVLRFAQAKGIPTFIHESNSFAGKSNILLGRKAAKVFTGTSGMEKFFPAEKIVHTGNPVRKGIAEGKADKAESLRSFSLNENKKTIVVVGGSLGAKTINEAVDKQLTQWTDADLQVIWQTGKLFVEKAKEKAKGNTAVWANDFITNMHQAFAAADIVVARAGAMTVAELTMVKKPAVLVPYPYAAEDHQTANAQALVKEGAAVMIKDAEAKEQLIPTVLELINDENKLNVMSHNMGKLAMRDADKIIAREILNTIGK